MLLYFFQMAIRLAIDAGADIVIELPTIYALSSATDFAFGAIKTISALTNVEYLVFGSLKLK